MTSPTTQAPRLTVEVLAERLEKEMLLVTPLAKVALRLALCNLLLLDSKQRDYGSSNLTTFGAFGVAVRATDKVSRLGNLLNPAHGGPSVRTESVADTFRDLANYGLIGEALAGKLWPDPSGAANLRLHCQNTTP